MEKYIDEEMLKENINKKIFYLVNANSFVAKDSSDYTSIQFNKVEIMNENGYVSNPIDCSIDLYDDEIIYLSAAQIGYISPSRGIWNPSIMSVKKTKISMKPFIQNEDIICMRKNGKVSYHTQFASAAIVKTYNKMMTNWDEYNEESEEYVISASLGYTLNSSVIELYEKCDILDCSVLILDCSVLILEDRTDVLDSSVLILESRIDDLEDTVTELKKEVDNLKNNSGSKS